MLYIIVIFGDNRKSLVKREYFYLMENELFAPLVYFSYNAKPGAHLLLSGDFLDSRYF